MFGASHGAVELLENYPYVFDSNVVCVVDKPETFTVSICGYNIQVISYDDFQSRDIYDGDTFINSVMDCDYKQRIYEDNSDLEWANFIDTEESFLPAIHGLKGVIIQPFCFVGSTCTVGKFVKLNHYAFMGYGSSLGDYSFLGTGTQLLANVKVCSKSVVYSNVTVLPNVVIGNNCIIGAGSVVTKDIPDNVVAYGNPCKVVRAND